MYIFVHVFLVSFKYTSLHFPTFHEDWDYNSHLIANDTNIPLNLGNPLSENSEELGNSGPQIQQNLPTQRIIWVKERELCKTEELNL